LVIAGTGNRRQSEFAREFAELQRQIAGRLGVLARTDAPSN